MASLICIYLKSSELHLPVIFELFIATEYINNQSNIYCYLFPHYYGFQTVCKCPFGALLVTLVTDSNQTWAN